MIRKAEEKVEGGWAEVEFAGVELKDKRLNKRCQKLAEELSRQPTGPINQASEDWADTKAAYRFFGNTKKVTPERIIAPHQERTVERMSKYKVVLAVQDTTFFNYSQHKQTKGLGEIGAKKQKQRGFGMHSTIAITPEGMPLGRLTQKFCSRPIGKRSHTPNELVKLPIEEKESYRWLEAFEETIRLRPAGVEVITVCDREGDIYEMFVLAQEKKAGLVIRAASDRGLTDKEVGRLWAKVEGQQVAGHLTLSLPQNQNRQARQATVSVRFTQVQLRPPWRPHHKKLPPITLNAILVREDNPPPDGSEPLEWLLLTNTSVQNFDEAIQVIGWYTSRWQIELFHKIIKSGCTVEDCRLQTADRLYNYIALMSVVAWRLHWLTYISRSHPNLPCSVILTPTEWQALYLHFLPSSSLPDTLPSVRQAVRWIAQLGGFLARKHDGEPGITLIWRGWQRLQNIAHFWFLLNHHSHLVGNR